MDGNKEQKEIQSKINFTARRVAERRLGRKYTPGDNEYRPMLRRAMYQHKQKVGIARKKPEEFTEEEANALLASLEEELHRG